MLTVEKVVKKLQNSGYQLSLIAYSVIEQHGVGIAGAPKKLVKVLFVPTMKEEDVEQVRKYYAETGETFLSKPVKIISTTCLLENLEKQLDSQLSKWGWGSLG